MIETKFDDGLTHYDILGVSHDAFNRDIRKAYKKNALAFHPDKQRTSDEQEKAKEKFFRMSFSYETLIDSEKRKIYDASLLRHNDKKSAPSEEHETKPSQESHPFYTNHTSSSNTSRGASHSRSSSRRSQHQGAWDFRTGRPAQQPENKPSTASQGSDPFCAHHTPFSSTHTGAAHRGNSSRRSQPQGTSRRSQPQDTPPSRSSRKQDRERLFGFRKDGQPCLRCQQQGRFCFQHKQQDKKNCDEEHQEFCGRASGSQEFKFQKPRKKQSFGQRKDGQPCKRCLLKGAYCSQHAHQDPLASSQNCRSQWSKSSNSTEHNGKDKVQFGTCRDGRECKRCVSQGRFCFQHEHQKYRS